MNMRALLPRHHPTVKQDGEEMLTCSDDITVEAHSFEHLLDDPPR
jgi:hypothetical protein